MKYFIFLSFSAILGACSKDGGDKDQDLITREGLLINQLAVDGCGWHFVIVMGDENIQYAADENSQTNLVEPFIQSIQSQGGVYNIKVEIAFSLTQNKRDVLCGWGKKSSMDEIEIRRLKAL